MSATLTAPGTITPVRADVVPEEPSEHSPATVAEEHRWLYLLVTPFILGGVFFALAVGTGRLWLMGPAMVLGPGLIIGMFIYLGLSSDTNAAG
jgi:hypothetical protein